MQLRKKKTATYKLITYSYTKKYDNEEKRPTQQQINNALGMHATAFRGAFDSSSTKEFNFGFHAVEYLSDVGKTTIINIKSIWR